MMALFDSSLLRLQSLYDKLDLIWHDNFLHKFLAPLGEGFWAPIVMVMLNQQIWMLPKMPIIAFIFDPRRMTI